VDESYREHQQIKDALNDLQTMDPNTDAFDRKFVDFKRKLMHHVDEEENEMFPIVRQRMSTQRQEELGMRIHDRKMSLKTRMAA
jgi:hemerythrin-like domain-containing protein